MVTDIWDNEIVRQLTVVQFLHTKLSKLCVGNLLALRISNLKTQEFQPGSSAIHFT
jgi:hypothetical protein